MPELTVGTTCTTCIMPELTVGTTRIIHAQTHCRHPFGKEWFEREQNVRKNSSAVSTGCLLADDLVSTMIAPQSADRPTTEQVQAHPYFWTDAKKLAFLLEVSDRIEKQDRASPLLARLEFEREGVLQSADWSTRLDKLLQADLRRFRTYKSDNVCDLLRAIRNKKHHYRELHGPRIC
jgi:serine/threonine-protein kinase/endoribonuclease IRE1